jgi:hypothetical protein
MLWLSKGVISSGVINHRWRLMMLNRTMGKVLLLAAMGVGMAAAVDLVGAAAALSACQEEPIEVAQQRALDKFGQFIKYEGRTIEILRPGDPRLRLQTETVGYFEIADPELMQRIGFPTDITIRFSEEDILSPPSTRKTIDPFGPNARRVESPHKLPAFWTDPTAPIIEEPNLNNNPVQKMRPPAESILVRKPTILDLPRDPAIEAEIAKLGLRNNPERVLTEQEKRDAGR